MAISEMMQGRVPVDIKRSAIAVIQESGLTVSDVIRVVMTKIAKNRRIPSEFFEPSAETLESLAQFERGEFESAKTITEMFNKLNA